MEKKLYRSRRQQAIAGVCGGIAEYFDTDVTLVRLLWAAVILASAGTGLILYILAAIIIPVNPYEVIDGQTFSENGEPTMAEKNYPSYNRNNLLIGIGVILVVIGGASLAKELFPFAWNLIREVTLPVILIVVGGAIIYSAARKNK